MNFSETFGTGPFAAATSSQAKGGFDFSIPATVSKSPASSAITIDDDQLLFSGTYKRDGGDLLISHDDRKVVIPDYFKGEARATLMSRDGAMLTGDIVKALTGYTEYAQATAPAPPKEIGSVQKLTGAASAIRNGVSVQLNVGDKVYKGDVLESGASSALGVTFVDGTVFNLSSNARMVLNEMVYDPNGSSNSSLLSLVQGTITFVAGQTAKNGNMRVDTPVATMGIRGTTVLVKINSTDGRVQLSVERDPDGKVGSFVIYDKTTGQIIGTVTREGDKTIISPSTTQGQQATTESVQKTQAEKVADLQLVQQVFQAFFPDVKKDPNNAAPNRQGNNGAGSPDPKYADAGNNGDKGGPEVKTQVVVGGSQGSSSGLTTGPRSELSPPVVVTSYADIQAPLANAKSFFIADQVQPNPLIVPYITGSAQLISATTGAPIPAGFNLDPLIVIDKPSGKISYDPEDFRFLGVGETAIYEVSFQSQSGPYIVTSTQRFVVSGINDAPIYTDNNFIAAVDEPLGTGSLTLFMKQGELKFNDADFSDVAAGYRIETTAVATFGEMRALPDAATLLSFLTFDEVTKAIGTTQGSIKETFSAPAKTFDYLAQGETVNIVYVIKVTDALGSTNSATLTVIITGTNDKPTITGATTVTTTSGAVVEDGALVANGSITFQDVDLSDSHVASALLASSGVSSPLPGFNPATSQLVKFLVSVDTEDTTDTNNIGRASWSYTLDNALAQLLAKDQVITQVYTVTITDAKGATVTQDVTVTVTGKNDLPTIETSAMPAGVQTAVSTVDSGSVTEDTAVVGGNLSAVGTIVFKDVDLIDTHTASFVLKSSDASVNLPGFNEGVVATSQTPISNIGTFAIGSLANLNGDVNDIGLLGWSFTLNNNHPTLQSLAVGQKITQVYTITITDNKGASVTRDVMIVINGTNDNPDNNAPVILASETDALGAVVEGNSTATLREEGTITFQDLDLIDAHTIPLSPLAPSSVTVTKNGMAEPLPGFPGSVGTLTLTRNEDTTDTINRGTVGWVFEVADNDPHVQALAAGQVITQNYTVTIDDNHGGIATQIVTITITGTNDDPVVATTDLAGAVSELVTPVNSIADTGTIAFTDVDRIDTHSITGIVASAGALGSLTAIVMTDTTGNGLGGVIKWDFSVPAAAVEYLAAGQPKVEIFTITLSDGNGGTVTRDITVTITGTNDAPVIGAIAQQDLNEQTTTAPLTATIAVTFGDVDLADVGHSAAITAVVASGVTAGLGLTSAQLIALVTPGTVTKDPGSPTGSVDLAFSAASTAFDYLATGQKLTLTYTVAIDDGDGGETPQTFVVEITGTNDAPVIDAVAQQDLDEQTTTDPLTATIAVTFGDVDLADVGHSAAITAVLASGVTAGLGLTSAQLIALVTPGTVTKDPGSPTGSVDLAFSAASTAFDYLATGQKLTLTYTVAIDDGDSGETPQTFVVEITGTNDAPVIDAVAQQDLDEQTTTDPLTATIAVTFGDVDLADVGHSAAITAVLASGVTAGLGLTAAQLIALVTPGTVTKDPGSATGSVDLAFSAASTAFNYLATGQKLTLTYTVAIDDGDGGETPQTFVVEITGTNDLPVFTAVAGDVQAVTITDTAGVTGDQSFLGNYHYTDADRADLHAGSGTLLTSTNGVALGGFGGGTNSEPAGANPGAAYWVYSIAGAKLDALGEGQTVTETANLIVLDGNGQSFHGQSLLPVTITLVGVNDKPVVTTAAFAVAEGGIAMLSAANLGITDPDNTSFVFSVTSTHGVFQTTDGVNGWIDATTFTSANLAANHVRFVHDGGEDAPTFSINASDGSLLNAVSDTVNGTVTFTNVNDAPVISGAAGQSVAENATGALVGTFSVSDVDTASGLTFAVLDSQGVVDPRFVVVAASGTTQGQPGSYEVYLAAGQSFDFEAENADSDPTVIRTIQVSDGQSVNDLASASITITVTDVSEGPVVNVFISPLDVNWSEPGNWSLGHVPVANEDVLIDDDHVVLAASVTIDGNEITVDGDDSKLQFEGASVTDAQLTGTNGGTFEVQGAGAGTSFTGTNVDAPFLISGNTTVTILEGATLTLSGYIQNAGTIVVDTMLPTTNLLIDGNVTINGGGYIVLEHEDEDIITSAPSSTGATLTLADNRISGSGQLGAGNLSIVLDKISSEHYGSIITDLGQKIWIDTGSGTLTNHGVIKSSGSGGIDIAGDIVNDGILQADGGVLEVHGDVIPTSMDLSSFGGGSISGGTLKFDGNVSIIVTFGIDPTLNGVDVDGTLSLNGHKDFQGWVGGMTYGDRIVFTGLNPAQVDLGPGDPYIRYGLNHSVFLNFQYNADHFQFIAVGDDTAVVLDRAPELDLAAGIEGNDVSTAINNDGTTIEIIYNGSLSDADTEPMESATVTLTNAAVGDFLNYDEQAISAYGISVTDNGDSIVLTGQASVEDYLAALQFVLFGTHSPETYDRIIEVTVNDGVVDSNVAIATISVTNTGGGVNVAPVLDLDLSTSGNDYAATFTLGGNPVPVVDTDVSIVNADGPAIQKITVTIIGPQPGDGLFVDEPALLATGFSIDSVNTTSTLKVLIGSGATDYAAALRAITFATESTDTTARDITVVVNDGLDSNTAHATITIDSSSVNNPPVAGNDTIAARAEYGAMKSTLTLYSDSDPDGDAFHISGASHGATSASYNPDLHIYTIEGLYGTLQLFEQFTSNVVFGIGGSTQQGDLIDANAGDYIFTLNKLANGSTIENNPILDLRPGQTLTDTFTYTITDSHGEPSEPATITVTFEPATVYEQVGQTGYSTADLYSDFNAGELGDHSSTAFTLFANGHTIVVGGKDLAFNVSGGGYTLTAGLIKSFHVTDTVSGVSLFDASRFNLSAPQVDDMGQTQFNALLATYRYDIYGSNFADNLRGGNLDDRITTNGGADQVHAGNGNDLIIVHDDNGWDVDGGDGIDTLKFEGSVHTGITPPGSNATNIEIFDLNTTDANSVLIDTQGALLINAEHTLRITGNASDAVNFQGVWTLLSTGVQYTLDSLTYGVSFDVYQTTDEGVFASAYVQNGITVNFVPSPGLSIETSAVEVAIADDTISFGGLSFSDPDGTAYDTYSIDPLSETGTLTLPGDDEEYVGTGGEFREGINEALLAGFTYTPIDTVAAVGKLRLEVSDDATYSRMDVVNFIFAENNAAPPLAGEFIELIATVAEKDVLTGSSYADNFVFSKQSGHDVITNFLPGTDKIQLGYDGTFVENDEVSFATWMQTHARELPGNPNTNTAASTLLDLDESHLGAHTVLLKNIALASLHAGDFIVNPAVGG